MRSTRVLVVASLLASAFAATVARRPPRGVPSVERTPPPAEPPAAQEARLRGTAPEAEPDSEDECVSCCCLGSDPFRFDPFSALTAGPAVDDAADRLPVEDRVEATLAWLAKRRCADGGWPGGDTAPCAGSAAPTGAKGEAAPSDVASTALAVLTFLASGYTNRSDDPDHFGRRVGDGLRSLKNRQDAEGAFAPRAVPTCGRDHAVVTWALVEIFGMTGSAIYKGPAAKGLEFLRRSRLASGAWSAGGPGAPEDPITTAWACIALGTARIVDDRDEALHEAGSLGVEDLDFGSVRRWAERGLIGARRTVFLAVLSMIERTPIDAHALAYAIRDLELEDPRRPLSSFWLHLAAVASGRARGEARRVATQALALPLALTQRRGVDPCDGAGAWDRVGPDPDGLGLVARTSLSGFTLTLWRSMRSGHVHGDGDLGAPR